MEVSFPGKVYNIYGNRYYIIVGGLSTEWTIVLDDGTYNTIHAVIGEIQRSIMVTAAKNDFPIERYIIQIRYANCYKCVKIFFTQYAFKGVRVYFSDDLATMLGFEPHKYYRYKKSNANKEIYAERPVLLSPGTANVYVYCDLLEHIKAPLLHVVNKKTDVSRIDDSRTYRLQSDTVYAAAEKVL